MSTYDRDVAIAIGHHFWKCDSDGEAENCGRDAARDVAQRTGPAIRYETHAYAVRAAEDARSELVMVKAERDSLARDTAALREQVEVLEIERDRAQAGVANLAHRVAALTEEKDSLIREWQPVSEALSGGGDIRDLKEPVDYVNEIMAERDRLAAALREILNEPEVWHVSCDAQEALDGMQDRHRAIARRALLPHETPDGGMGAES